MVRIKFYFKCRIQNETLDLVKKLLHRQRKANFTSDDFKQQFPQTTNQTKTFFIPKSPFNEYLTYTVLYII